jgi:hypothetical protein
MYLRPDAFDAVPAAHALNMVMDAMIAVPRWRDAMQAEACVAEKSLLTNRVRRHFARNKAIRADRGQSWLLR